MELTRCSCCRGRYTIKAYPTFLEMHGKTFDYKIPYKTVLQLILLPHNDQRSMFFVVSVSIVIDHTYHGDLAAWIRSTNQTGSDHVSLHHTVVSE